MNNMLKKEWIKKIKSLLILKKASTQKIDIAPYRDWRTVVITFFIGLVFSLGLNAYLFMEINKGSFFVATQNGEELIKFNKEGLTKVLEELQVKEVVFEELKTKGLPMVDPSR